MDQIWPRPNNTFKSYCSKDKLLTIIVENSHAHTFTLCSLSLTHTLLSPFLPHTHRPCPTHPFTNHHMHMNKCFSLPSTDRHQDEYTLKLCGKEVRGKNTNTKVSNPHIETQVSNTLHRHTGMKPTHRHTGMKPLHRHTGIKPTHTHTGIKPTHRHTGIKPLHRHTGIKHLHRYQTPTQTHRCETQTHRHTGIKPTHRHTGMKPTLTRRGLHQINKWHGERMGNGWKRQPITSLGGNGVRTQLSHAMSKALFSYPDSVTQENKSNHYVDWLAAFIQCCSHWVLVALTDKMTSFTHHIFEWPSGVPVALNRAFLNGQVVCL